MIEKITVGAYKNAEFLTSINFDNGTTTVKGTSMSKALESIIFAINMVRRDENGSALNVGMIDTKWFTVEWDKNEID